MLVFTGACHDESYRAHSDRDEADAVALPSHVYGACDAYVVTDRDKGIDLSLEEEFFRPAVFKLKIVADAPTEVEILMLASNDDPLYPQHGSLLRISVTQQSDLLLKDGKRAVSRYRGNSVQQKDSVDIDWYAEAEAEAEAELDTRQGTERVVRVDFASDPYDNAEGMRRWGKHYVCHRNAGINALAPDIYTEQATPPATNEQGS